MVHTGLQGVKKKGGISVLGLLDGSLDATKKVVQVGVTKLGKISLTVIS